jgi:hypothetical protein
MIETQDENNPILDRQQDNPGESTWLLAIL